MPSNADRLAAIRQRVDAATKGPWFHGRIEESDGNVCITHAHHDVFRQYVEVQDAREKAGLMEARLVASQANVMCVLGDEADVDFIAHCRENVPFLLDEIARLRKQAAACREIVETVSDFVCECLMDGGEDCAASGAQDDGPDAWCLSCNARRLLATLDGEIV